MRVRTITSVRTFAPGTLSIAFETARPVSASLTRQGGRNDTLTMFCVKHHFPSTSCRRISGFTTPGSRVTNVSSETDEGLAQAQTSERDDGLLTVAINPEGITVNEQPVAIADLRETLALNLRLRDDRTVLVVPSDLVTLKAVVDVLDIAKSAGAESLALLNETEEGG